MKTRNFNSVYDLIEMLKEEYHHDHYDSYAELAESANEHFLNIAEEGTDDPQGFFSDEGLTYGECFIRDSKEMRFYIEDENCEVEVNFYECYVDSGVPAEDYIYGCVINYI